MRTPQLDPFNCVHKFEIVQGTANHSFVWGFESICLFACFGYYFFFKVSSLFLISPPPPYFISLSAFEPEWEFPNTALCLALWYRPAGMEIPHFTGANKLISVLTSVEYLVSDFNPQIFSHYTFFSSLPISLHSLDFYSSFLSNSLFWCLQA